MPAQKRSLPDSLDEGDTSQQNLFHSRHAKQQQQDQSQEHDEDENEDEEGEDGEEEEGEEEGEGEGEEDEEEEEEEEVEEAAQHDNNDKEKPQDSDETPSSGSEEKPEFVYVELLEIRKDVQCPICLGIIKKTRTVMECLHRFCRECIDKSMRLGNNECPACRTHCASRRSLRDDPNYDALIAALYPDIEKYEQEELEFREEEKNRNKQIQASIAKVVQRQSEALVKRRKDTPGAFVTRPQRNQRNIHSRRQTQAIEGSEDNEEENDNNEKDSSSADERSTEHRQRRRKRWARVRPSQPSSSMASPDGGCNDSDMDISKENRGISRQVSKHGKLTWGRGGFRSNTRHGSGGGSNNKSSRSSRLSKFVDHLRNLDENTDEFDVHLMLVSLDQLSTPSLQQPYLCCRPTLSVKHLYEHVARQTPLPVEGIEIVAVKGCCSTNCDKSADENSALAYDELSKLVIDPHKDELEILQGHETLAGLRSKCISKMGHLVSVKVFYPLILL
ncbi:putative E3 ubiquitin-protein ligase RING1a isoform A [Glycine soja]|uniref:Putative E3 ubiquitin-protein ligase RING1a isoform A n=1 Tax=Glycine soja TaxID=3848 RepID=A0A445HT75_GLYSO|nr:putative E3 ubiquitin-protein ligase RING1a isoform A [Glycine soja]